MKDRAERTTGPGTPVPGHGLRRCAAAALALAALAGLASGAGAATLSVGGPWALDGIFGVEIGVGDACSAPQDEFALKPPPVFVSGDFDACEEVSVSGVRVVAPGATVRAGESIRFFGVVGLAAPFAAVIDNLWSSSYAYLRDRSPYLEVAYKARFALNLDGLTLAAADRLHHFEAVSSLGAPVFRLTLEWDPMLGAHLVSLAARLDGGGWAESAPGEEIPLAGGWNTLEVDWYSGLGDGHLRLSVNGSPPAGLGGLANGEWRVDSVRWGAVAGPLAGASGSLLMDSFSSWR